MSASRAEPLLQHEDALTQGSVRGDSALEGRRQIAYSIARATRRQVASATRPFRRGFRRLTAPLRAEPGFLIIGAQKSGTSSLFDHLARHPMVGRPSRKEIGFFDCNFEKGLSWYRSHFPVRAGMAARGRILTGEATPYYLFHPLAAHRVRDTYPDIKIIALLRNPIDRAYSHYQHEKRNGHEKLTFFEALEAEPERLRGEAEKLKREPGCVSLAHRRFSYVSRGIYIRQLRTWTDALSGGNILVIQSESLFESPADVLPEIDDFLGLPAVTGPPDFKHVNRARYPPLDPALRERLAGVFEPHNKELYAFLRQDFGWR